MPVKPHPTDPDKVVYVSRHYDIPQLQGVTTTPQRPWVGLTDAERHEIWKGCDPTHAGYVTALVEAKLKERNT